MLAIKILLTFILSSSCSFFFVHLFYLYLIQFPYQSTPKNWWPNNERLSDRTTGANWWIPVPVLSFLSLFRRRVADSPNDDETDPSKVTWPSSFLTDCETTEQLIRIQDPVFRSFVHQYSPFLAILPSPKPFIPIVDCLLISFNRVSSSLCSTHFTTSSPLATAALVWAIKTWQIKRVLIWLTLHYTVSPQSPTADGSFRLFSSHSFHFGVSLFHSNRSPSLRCLHTTTLQPIDRQPTTTKRTIPDHKVTLTALSMFFTDTLRLGAFSSTASSSVYGPVCRSVGRWPRLVKMKHAPLFTRDRRSFSPNLHAWPFTFEDWWR